MNAFNDINERAAVVVVHPGWIYLGLRRTRPQSQRPQIRSSKEKYQRVVKVRPSRAMQQW